MPVNLIDPTVQPVGAGIPNSPLAGMFGKAVNAYGSTFPNAMDRAQIDYHNAETAKIQQQLGASGQLANIFNSALNAQPVADPNAPPVEGPRPTPDSIGPQPPTMAMRTPAPDEIIRNNMPQLVAAMQAGGHIENTPQIARMMAAYLPGAAQNVANAPIGTPSNMDMAMLGSGESYESTPGGSREKNQQGYTSEQKNRVNKINAIMGSQGVDYPTAEGLTDGVLDLTTDQAGNRVLVNKATGASRLLYSMASGASSDGRPGAPSAAPSAVTPSPGVPSVGKPVNNPFNLRPVGATEGFQQFATPQQGMMAGLNDLSIKLSGQSKAMGGKTPTLRNIISTYSPPNENATQALIQNAAARMGVNPDVPLGPQHLVPLAQAILQQEQGGTTATAPAAVATATPAITATPTSFKMNLGDLGLPFDTMYGGPAVAGRAGHTISSFVGDQTPDPALAAFGKLNTLKNGLVNAMSTMPGRAANEGTQKRLIEQFPETNSNLLETQNGIEQGGINPVDAETKFNQGVEQGAALYEQATEALKNPMLDAKTRDAYQTVKSTIQKTFLQTLPGGKYAEFLKSVGEAPPAGQPAAPIPGASNLETGLAATTMPKYESVPGQSAITAADIAETAKANHMTNQQVIDKLREQGRVK